MKWDLRPPELLALSKKDRKRVWNRVYYRSLRRPRMWIPLVAIGVGHMLVTIGVQSLMRYWDWRSVVARMVLSSVSMVVMILIFGRYAVRALNEELLAHVKNSCLNCFYDLTGNESGVCPECGTPRQPIAPAAK